MLTLYGYWRSSAAYRVRIALNLKGLDYEYVAVDLLAGAERQPDYLRRNPQGLVPTLIDGTHTLTQSLAICEYLEERHPTPALLPSTPAARARVRALAQAVACEIHPLNNLRVLKHLVDTLAVSEEQKLAWYRHWVHEGFAGIERMLAESEATGRFCHGDAPTLADVCLVPQVYNAERFGCDLSPFPTIARINAACLELEAFAAARPERQPDAR